MNNRKNFKHLLFAAGIFFALFIFTSSFTACSSHILDIQEGLQSAPTPTSASAPIPAPTTYTVTVTSGEHGAISVDKTNAAAGETITITVTPEADYMLDVLTITDSSGNAIAISAAKTFTMPESDVTVSGTFKIAPYAINVMPATNGAISVDKTNAARFEIVTITVNPDNDYVLDAITVTDANGNSVYVNTNNNTFFMPESNVTVNCTFRVRQLLIATSLSYTLLNDLQANSTATGFVHSTTPPVSGTTTYILSEYNSDVELVAWLEGTTIKFYAEGYTDSNRKIPLPADSKYLFGFCSSLQKIDLSCFDTSNVTDMSFMFADCKKLETIVFSNKFLTSNVETMAYMFCGCENLTTLNLSGFDTAAVTDMRGMFDGCKKLETIVFSNKFLTSNVETMASMFSSCESLTSLDLSSFDTSNVTDMHHMFILDYSLTTIFVGDGFDTSNVTNSDNMFGACQSLVGGVGTTHSYSNPDDKTYARIDGGPSNPGYFTRKQ